MQRPTRPGQRVRVKHCAGAYRLPEGLPEGAWVTLETFDHGYWTVRHEGKTFKVFSACLDVGFVPAE